MSKEIIKVVVICLKKKKRKGSELKVADTLMLESIVL